MPDGTADIQFTNKMRMEKKGDTFLEILSQDWTTLVLTNKCTLVLYIGLALGLSGFHLYTAYFGLLEAWSQRAVHLDLVLMLVFFTPQKKEIEGKTKYYINFYNVILGLAAFCVGLFMYYDYMNIIYERVGDPNLIDQIACWTLVVLILEASRQRVGLPITLLGLFFWIYTVWGHYIPGYLGHPRFSFSNITDFFFNTPMGIFGIPTAVSALYIILFIILAAFLYYANASDFFLKLAFTLTGTWRGGPAKAAVVASGIFGSIHGSGPGNVMATGVFTIPLMKRLGYPSHFAGAVEAVASTGGILLPPVMGATAFLIAEFTRTPYLKVCLYGLVPALCYYLVIFIMIHIEAVKRNLPTVERSKLPAFREVLKDSYLLAPIILIVVVLALGYSVFRAASVAIVAVVLLSFIRASTRMSFRDFFAALEKGASNALVVAVTCFTASIIVGSVSMTGFGTKLANLITTMSMGHLWLALFFTMIVAIVCGMGMPATPVYVILVSTAAPALLKMGVPIIVSHFFIYYFGTMAALTPPVALSCYAAASVANTGVTKLSFTALKLALAGFIIPFMFVYNPALLLMTDFKGAIYALSTAIPGFIAMAVAIAGYFYGSLNFWRKTFLFAGAMFLIWSGIITDVIGIALILFSGITQYFRHLRITKKITERKSV